MKLVRSFMPAARRITTLSLCEYVVSLEIVGAMRSLTFAPRRITKSIEKSNSLGTRYLSNEYARESATNNSLILVELARMNIYPPIEMPT